jgi:5-methylcytosine-specific restriction endonuclease McrA
MDTLVLSNAYEPVARVHWQRAVTLIWEGKVEVIEEYESRTVRSVTLEFKVPSIIRFINAIRRRKPAVKFSRENVYLRDKGCCQYCGKKVPRSDFTYDHVLPRSQGGQTAWNNVVVCCTPCNQRKKNGTPTQAKMHLLSVPVKPEHIQNTMRLTFLLDKNVPQSWKQLMTDYGYWQGELDHDGE